MNSEERDAVRTSRVRMRSERRHCQGDSRRSHFRKLKIGANAISSTSVSSATPQGGGAQGMLAKNELNSPGVK